jgi:predicted dehydrogenase
MGEGKRMRLVQIGLGSFGRKWAGVVRASDGFELAAAVDPVETSRDWMTATLGLAPGNCLSSLDQALERTDWEAALVVTPPETHHAVATTALRAGKHVLLEKPLATTLADARDLVATAAEHERVLMVSQNYRFRAPARAVQNLIKSGEIGAVLAVKASCRRDTRTTFPAGDFRYLMRHPYVVDMAIHHFDLLRALTGRDVLQVCARSWRVPDSPYRHSPAVTVVMTLEGGAVVSYDGDWAAHGRETSWNGEWEVVGEKGRVIWTGGEQDASQGDVRLQCWGGAEELIEQPLIEANDQAGTLKEFADAVRTGRQPETSGADNIRSLAVVLACVESIDGGGAVDVAMG